MAKRPLT